MEAITKKELIEELENLKQACRSFQFAYSMYEEGDEPEQMTDIWDMAESIIAYAEGQWVSKW